MSQNQYYPTMNEIENEYVRLKKRKRKWKLIFVAIISFSLISLLSIVFATFYFPMYEITGSSMNPTLNSKNYVLTIKTQYVERNDIIVFYYYGKTMIKRVIAVGGDEVDIAGDGTVWVNQEKLEEDYAMDLQLGISNLKFPYVVPEGEVFVLNDNRNEMLDSRNENFGCIDENQIIGKVIFIL